MRIGSYYIEIGINAYDILSMVLLSVLWFLGIFAFRVSVAFLELLPQLGSLAPDFQLSPRLELLTWQVFLSSLILAIFLGPFTHSVVTRAAAIKVFKEAMLPDVPEETAESAPDENERAC